LPEFAADLDLPGRAERGADNGCAANHSLRAGENFAATCTQSDPGEPEGDCAKAQSCSQRRCGVDPQFWDRAIDKRCEAEDEAANADQREDAVASELRLEHN
jgi:hypothetical protein